MSGKGDASDPAWIAIEKALKRAGDWARGRGYIWTGESCYWVTRAALLLVIDTRDGLKEWKIDHGPTLEGEDAGSVHLVYADHYLQARGDSSRMGHVGTPFLYPRTRLYEEAKSVAYGLKDLPNPFRDSGTFNPWDPTSRMLPTPMQAGSAILQMLGNELEYRLRENKSNPVSRPDERSVYWADEGLKDGIDDWKNNPKLPGWKGDAPGEKP
jgi:hypothetical protein